jgi:LytS/YehU family sensor histidine kinase
MKQNSRRFLLFSLFLLIAQLTFAQEKEIQGTVTSKADGSPLLFLSFVENCFKHGLKENDKIKIVINFKVVAKRYLEFTIVNSFNPSLVKSDGIGNVNARRRLKLLYANDFIMESKVSDDSYNLFLKIPI